MKHVLIAGGTGLIGQKITNLLLNKGIRVSYLSRRARNGESIPTHKWDVDQGFINVEGLDDVDVIINLAGAGIADKRWTDQRKKLIIDSRVKGNLLLKKYIDVGKLTPKKIVCGAAIGIYGDRPANEIITEESKVGSDGFLVESCLKWEESILALESTNIPLALIRIGIVLSKDGGAFQKMVLPAKFGLGSYFGDGSQVYSWIHIDDIARLFIWISECPISTGIFNGTAPKPVTNLKLTKEMMAIKKGPGILAPVPNFALNLILGEMKSVVLFGSNVIPKRLLDKDYIFEFENINQALRNLLS